MSNTIDYYHFLVSPWSYLAIDRFNDMVSGHGAEVRYKPIAPMATFNNMGGQPLPKRHPSRRLQRMTELKRWSAYLGVPMNFEPAHFPVDPSLASRMVLAAGNAAENAGALSDAVLCAVWRDEKNITDRETLSALATSCGLNGEALLAEAESDSLEEQYKAVTREAHDADVFGSPTWVVNGENFWGQDRLDFLERALAG